MRLRPWMQCAGVAVAFGLGLGAHALTGARIAPVALTAEAATSCTDPAAMAANRNLVEQLHDVNARLGVVLGAADPSERAPAVSKEREGSLSPSAAEWARMAREGVVRVLVPCGTQDAVASLEVHTGETASIETGRGAGSLEARAKLAGLGDRELEALGEAYALAHARTWAKMKDACAELERDAPSSEDGAERAVPEDDFARIAACRGFVDHEGEGFHYVAKLRAAGARAAPSRSPRDRALFAYAGAADELARAMAEKVGQEKAALARSFGAVCLDELVFDTREAPASEAPASEAPASEAPASEGDEPPAG